MAESNRKWQLLLYLGHHFRQYCLKKLKKISAVMSFKLYCETTQLLKRGIPVWFQSQWLRVRTDFRTKAWKNNNFKMALKVGLFFLEQPDFMLSNDPRWYRFESSKKAIWRMGGGWVRSAPGPPYFQSFLFGQFPCLALSHTITWIK